MICYFTTVFQHKISYFGQRQFTWYSHFYTLLVHFDVLLKQYSDDTFRQCLCCCDVLCCVYESTSTKLVRIMERAFDLAAVERSYYSFSTMVLVLYGIPYEHLNGITNKWIHYWRRHTFVCLHFTLYIFNFFFFEIWKSLS